MVLVCFAIDPCGESHLSFHFADDYFETDFRNNATHDARSRKENVYASGLAATKTQTRIAQADFDGIAQRGQGNHFDLLALEQPHLHETLHQRIVARQGRDAATLARTQLIERRHGSARYGADEDLRSLLAAKREAAAADLEQARPTRLEQS